MVWYLRHVESKKKHTNELTYKTVTDSTDSKTQRMNLQLLAAGEGQGVENGRKDSQGVWGGHIHTAVFKMDNQQGPTAQHRELCSVLCGSLDGRRVWRSMDTCVCLAESLHCSPEIITALLIGCTPIQFFFFNALLKPFGKSGSFLSTSHLFSSLGPATILSLLQTLTSQFVGPHCVLSTQTCTQ